MGLLSHFVKFVFRRDRLKDGRKLTLVNDTYRALPKYPNVYRVGLGGAFQRFASTKRSTQTDKTDFKFQVMSGTERMDVLRDLLPVMFLTGLFSDASVNIIRSLAQYADLLDKARTEQGWNDCCRH